MAYTHWKDIEQVERYAEKRYRSWDQRWLNKQEQKIVTTLFKDYKLCGAILDIPVGYGRFLPILREFGTIYAADWGFMPLVYQAKNVGISSGSVNGIAQFLPFKSQSIDVIFCFRLFQHMHEQEERIAILKEFKRVSRNWIVVSVYIKNPLHILHRAVAKKPSRITMLTRSDFKGEVSMSGLKTVQKRAVVPGLHAHNIYLISTK
ncbi:MAG: methyltransferase domain-containing protein [Candidatus Marinimicrobia bacterium]|nr:methyltransferase domain-containing protein [Candidatus Neomarinimicrobiota bacterium]